MSTKLKVIPRLLFTFCFDRDHYRLALDNRHNDFPASNWLLDILRARNLPTADGKIYHFGLILGDAYKDEDRVDENIDADAMAAGAMTPPALAAYYLAEKINAATLARLGLREIILMHEPIVDLRPTQNKFRIGLCFEENGKSRMEACYGRIGGGWLSKTGFVYSIANP